MVEVTLGAGELPVGNCWAESWKLASGIEWDSGEAVRDQEMELELQLDV